MIAGPDHADSGGEMGVHISDSPRDSSSVRNTINVREDSNLLNTPFQGSCNKLFLCELSRTTMRIPRLLLPIVFTVFFVAVIGHAQNTVIMQKWVSESRALAGHANIGLDRGPADGITVELCSPGWKTVLASTKTDRSGYFSLDKPKSGDLFYIRLSAPGVNPYQLRVRLNKSTGKELAIHLSIAT
jgi:hypothetical protein